MTTHFSKSENSTSKSMKKPVQEIKHQTLPAKEATKKCIFSSVEGTCQYRKLLISV